MQNATVDLLINAIYANNAMILQPIHLLASDTSNDGVQMPLPDNQWILELQDMHSRVLTSIQRSVVDYARGPSSLTARQFLTIPDKNFKSLCSMIRARTSGRFASVNTYGLAVTVGLGTAIVLMNVFLESVIRGFQRWRKVPHRGVDAWVEDGLLQVHRDTLILGEGEEWRGTDGAVPVTRLWGGIVKERVVVDENVGGEKGKKSGGAHKRVSIHVEDVDAVRRVGTDETLVIEDVGGLTAKCEDREK